MISPTLAKLISKMPKSVVNFFSKKVMDYYINKYAHMEVNGFENIKDANKPILFIGNHLSNSDGLILNKLLKDYDVTFVAGAKLSNDPITSMGINIVKTITIKPNTADKEALTKVINTLKSGNNVLIFPEGTRSRTGSMIEAKRGVVLIARLTKATIIPIGISGTEKLLPINKDGNMSGENFYHAKVKVNIGEAIGVPPKEKEEDKHQYEDRVLNHMMRSISALLPEEYRGVYK
ncbi:lysophospholipid acyltransferase family protein [Clostridium amazonitimonense]|uniref:lysophospholipid acyltransferase family protein n=1 Tax=Clostridium amazonitimonense TaxID=1499689 RepID=UPI000509D7FF|nr:lysophospholipid acyltransferase family protein [Clostridium amazonitimonense]